jgi:23S rRNA (cytosine1962-C5)-methyltransferase
LIRLTLKPGREASVLRRHPWLFSGAVARREGDGADGHAEVRDAQGQHLARGAYSPESQIVARLWTFDGRTPDEALFEERFRAARSLREEIVPAATTGFRALNSEGDLCPGVLLDVYADAAVLELTTGGSEVWRPEIERAIRQVFSSKKLIVRETGSARDGGRRLLDPLPVGEGAEQLVEFTENGLRFFADVASGQKTGFFLDQRENRSRLRLLSKGRTVLNLFSYSGAFSVAALAGGADRAVDVDSSEPALELARQHRRANGLAAAERDFICADVFEDLRRRVAEEERWDIVICDPPAFAKKKGDLPRACRGYKDINRLAMSLLSAEGWLLTCSCSGLLSADLFQKVVFSASAEARATFLLVARQGAGADHPVSLECPEGEYLKGLWLKKVGD